MRSLWESEKKGRRKIVGLVAVLTDKGGCKGDPERKEYRRRKKKRGWWGEEWKKVNQMDEIRVIQCNKLGFTIFTQLNQVD